tara:strand:+ start:1887 stop:2333 length:447 start_codon:yes stop_codon:yes gene_type:complete
MRNILLILILLLYGCGFTPLYSNKNLNEFIFKEIEVQGDRDINRSLISSTFFKEDKQNFLFEKLILKNEKTIIETSKNSKGVPESYRMTINFQITIIDKGKIIKEKGFTEDFSYKNLDNKIDLYEYEINVQNNLIKKITEELIVYLNI